MKRDLEEVTSEVLCKAIENPVVQEMIVRIFAKTMENDRLLNSLKQRLDSTVIF